MLAGAGRTESGADLLSLREIIEKIMDNKFRIEESLHGDSDRPKLEEIYMTSFPADERREWALVERLADDPSSPMTMLKITDGEGRAAGLLTIWRFEGLSYIEHFAVDSGRRGSGLGSKVLSRVVKAEMPVPIVIEVEPPGDPAYGPMAARRVDFYRRHGFTAFEDFDYVQPPYAPGLKEVVLMLMATRDDVDPGRAASLIHRHVYNKK